MVNTRRKESNGSLEGSVNIKRGRPTLIKQETEDNSSSTSANESDSQYSGEKRFIQPSSRQLRSKFSSYGAAKYSFRPLRSSHKRISVDQRELTLYSQKMSEDSDFEQGNDYEGDIYSNRSDRSRHLLHKRRIRRRTALSLRPVSQSYVDTHAIPFGSESETTSKRRRGKQNANMSWLGDSQMHKVGYPNLHTGYSEEDSRDAVDADHSNMDITRRVTRRNNLRLRHEVETPKYLFDYDVNTATRRSRRHDKKDVENDLESTRRTLNDKENKEEEDLLGTRLNGRHKKNPVIEDNSNEEEKNADEVADEKQDKEVEENDEVNGKCDKEEDQEDAKKEESSDSDDEEQQRKLPVTKLRTTKNSSGINNDLLLNSVRSLRKRRVIKRRIGSSSESEEEESRTYSLRNRGPKPAPKTIQEFVLRKRAIRGKGFNRRRNSSSSSSDSSSTSSNVHRSKPPKSSHYSKNSKNDMMKTAAGGSTKIVPIQPETLDRSIRFGSIGGLDGHIQCLKEMILLPMMYPEVFKQFHIQPPRGVLFHGPPGTGKTLIARALANECSFGTKKVSFFLRKGADLLSKWIGESERQLRVLFEQAAKMKPSIIFFDELDGLAPVRSSRQDLVHVCIVSTLLALMDGLSDRGEVIVIGATNRIDSIDPALRRPGRFDRELFFPLPSKQEREEILNVHTSRWASPPSKQLLEYLAEHTVGYCGSDLKGLCSEAVIQSFRRTYPQVYNSEHKLLLQPENVKVEKVDFMRAKSLMVAAAHRITQGLGRKLFPLLEPLLQESLNKSLKLLEKTFPHGLSSTLAKVKLSPNIRPAQFLITGDGPGHGQTSHVAPAILNKMEHIHAYMLNLVMLYQDTNRSTEEACIQVFNEARKNVPSIVYVPSIDKWWSLVSETVRAIFKSQLTLLEPNIPILFLATSESLYVDLTSEIQQLFSYYRNEVLELKPATSELRKDFFRPLIIENSLKPVRRVRERPRTPPPLPRAPTPPPTPLNEEESRKLFEQEEHTLRELRIFLRDMCKKLANNKLFFMFTKPVDTEEVPDYPNIIKQPMDLETMMTKVDFHRYECARDFLNDIELICQNALEYNPAKTSADKQIRHRACSLRDYAYTLIKTEMDTDFEDKCQEISHKRRQRKHCPSKYLPPYINTEMKNSNINKECLIVSKENDTPTVQSVQNSNSKCGKTEKRKRKRIWQKGQIRKKIKKPDNSQQNDRVSSNSESKDEDSIKASTSQTSKTNSVNAIKQEEEEEKDNCIVDATSPLTVNCDSQINSQANIASPLQSPKRRLSDIFSPSDLLDNPLDFDDVDEALNETATDNVPTVKTIECSAMELETVLDTAVMITDGFSLVTLLDLYNNLNRIIKQFSKSHERTNLPKELAKELLRFKKDRTPDHIQKHKVISQVYWFLVSSNILLITNMLMVHVFPFRFYVFLFS
ncbi:unnamed protein product [Phyllotreta striolata]|uniref:Tat-binding homolog 7 n=1 Tax=Phyllotreta striolata TaxID=444603 RepID=A0A9N9TDH5_PHYSR|nr:unnamed protein product [Phyllotreta striolata]